MNSQFSHTARRNGEFRVQIFRLMSTPDHFLKSAKDEIHLNEVTRAHYY